MITEWSDLFRPGEASSFLDRRPLPLFHPQAAAFDANNAWWLAELSRLLYRHDIEESPFLPQPRRTEFLAQVGLRQVAFFNAKREGTKGFLVESFDGPPFAALVFRGTEDLRDWLTNLKVPHATGHDIPGLVHKGFLRALDESGRMSHPPLPASPFLPSTPGTAWVPHWRRSRLLENLPKRSTPSGAHGSETTCLHRRLLPFRPTASFTMKILWSITRRGALAILTSVSSRAALFPHSTSS